MLIGQRRDELPLALELPAFFHLPKLSQNFFIGCRFALARHCRARAYDDGELAF